MTRYYVASLVIHALALFIMSLVPNMPQWLDPDDYMRVGGRRLEPARSATLYRRPKTGKPRPRSRQPRRPAVVLRGLVVPDAAAAPEEPEPVDLFPDVFLRPGADGKGAGAPGADDFEGDGGVDPAATHKYNTFWRRVEATVIPHWHPQELLTLRDPTAGMWMFRDRRSIVGVELTPDGTIRRVWLDQSCGADFLDEAAMTAIWAARQFPNPPAGVVRNGAVKFQFAFTVLRPSGVLGLYEEVL